MRLAASVCGAAGAAAELIKGGAVATHVTSRYDAAKDTRAPLRRTAPRQRATRTTHERPVFF